MKNLRPVWCVLLGLACFFPARLHGATQPEARNDTAPSGWTGKALTLLHVSFESLLDDDRRPDVVRGETQGTSYQITIQLSARNESVSLGFYGVPGDVALSAVDVDRDNHRDLVIASPGNLFPVAVWLNDGQGHFTQADPKRYAVPDSPTTRDGSIHHEGNSEGRVLATIQYWRFSLDKPFVAFHVPAGGDQPGLVPSAREFSAALLHCVSPRAPPSSVIL
jgi:hypothetical protein